MFLCKKKNNNTIKRKNDNTIKEEKSINLKVYSDKNDAFKRIERW